ncbi:glycosyltransferase family 2 protein [Spirosoma endophyticum]|uniref:Glycosyl transferase family 2 n=1 Tax=Spirosoma endophyticum TaxID=662367 RepID=A0A1I1X239_9BACT|nr:glycosyltransferase family 2 protein [Spirosoma endophyticum]SFE01456.1 Glycosyl transferase family 2 [Spirosoma endophyticum]
MQRPKFTIVIPTRERADTLLYSLQTCVMQDYDQLSIVVSDNFSQDETKDVVHSINDPRIRYVNTGRRLSMSGNYEFGLSQVKDGFVTLLGDDDGFLPNSVKTAADWLSETGSKAINLNPADYLWPSFFNADRANTLYIKFRSGYHLLNGKEELQKTLTGTKSYADLPCLYTSFIDRSVIDKVQTISGAFFHSRIPDVYSAISLAPFAGNYIYADQSLKLFGTSKKSIGASLVYDAANQEAAQTFLNEDNLPIHPRLSSTLGRSVSIVIAESFLQSFDQGLNQEILKDFDLTIFIRQALQEAYSSAKGHRAEILTNVREILVKNKLPMTEFDALISQYEQSPPGPVRYDVSRYFQPFALVDALAYGVTDIAGAAKLYDKIYRHPFRYPGIIPSTIKKTLKSATLDLLLERFRKTKKSPDSQQAIS